MYDPCCPGLVAMYPYGVVGDITLGVISDCGGGGGCCLRCRLLQRMKAPAAIRNAPAAEPTAIPAIAPVASGGAPAAAVVVAADDVDCVAEDVVLAEDTGADVDDCWAVVVTTWVDGAADDAIPFAVRLT